MEITLNNPIITKMAMHVVGDIGGEQARHLPATAVVHQDFFIGRISETAKGCKCTFDELSLVLNGLKRIKDEAADFYEMSKLLANNFHRAIVGNGATVPGAFLLFEIDNGGDTIYSIIKYEHDDVVHYENKVEDDGSQRLIFNLLATTFVKKPQAMQKSALIKFDDRESVIHVIDRSERKGITQYFATYLGAIRDYNEAEATSRLIKAVNAFVDRAVKLNILPKEVRKTYRSRMYDYTRRDGAGFNSEEISEFLTAVVGDSTDELRSIFQSELAKQRIDGESFEIDKASVSRPSKLRTRTVEGIEINFTQHHIDTEKYKRVDDTIVIDVSTGLEEDASQLG